MLLVLQTSAHSEGGLPGAPSTHAGWAVVPLGTLVGQGAALEQEGQHILPARPVIDTSCSPVSHGPLYGSPSVRVRRDACCERC